MNHSENLQAISRTLRLRGETLQGDECEEAADELDRLQAIVAGMEAVGRGDYVVEYGWNSDENRMGYWWGKRGSFVSDRLTWTGASSQDAWLAIGQAVSGKARKS